MSKKAEILINGSRGQSFATVECEEDGKIHSAMAEAALAHALNLYNELDGPEYDINPDRAKLKREGKWQA